MSYGIELRDSSGYLFYSSAQDSDLESILVLDAFTVHSSQSGSKTYAQLNGGSLANLRWMQFPRIDGTNLHTIWLDGSTLHWSAPAGGLAGYSDIIVTIS